MVYSSPVLSRCHFTFPLNMILTAILVFLRKESYFIYLLANGYTVFLSNALMLIGGKEQFIVHLSHSGKILKQVISGRYEFSNCLLF